MNPKTVGVIVARFQVPKLHTGHRYLIEYVSARSDTLIIVLGTARSFPTSKNPLSFEMRRRMLARHYPHAIVVPLRDTRLDSRWSADLDAAIAASVPEHDAETHITLYGSRESFISYYSGTHRTELVPPLGKTNGTNHRKRLADAQDSVKFREGVIHTQMSRPPAVYPTVDVAIIRRETREVLLGGKTLDGGALRFIGGFVDATDPSYACAARREVYEETTGVEIADLVQLGSTTIDDWRYRDSDDSVMTTFFCATYVFGAPRAHDDLDHLVWVPLSQLTDVLIPEHEPLGRMLLTHLSQSS